ncbi:zonular occludens toxin domain-containing protein [Xanthomonas campestris]|uniref:zonular occludens toxin domain-containing protein n=1 Tax=Xanthomonas campestris TaxID=339 RepID=UPI003CED65CD
MLHLITGQNGSGKSLRAIQIMYERHGQGMEVYACGFRGLKAPFVKPFADPRRWSELPPNSVLFVDEAQQVWRTRGPTRPVPPEVQALETHRHQGIDIYLITQSPMYLDSHIRPLITTHQHLVSYDKGSARLFQFSECREDVKSSALRNKADFKVWRYPTEHYADYESAEVHTAKPKIPWRQRAAKLLFVGAFLLVLYSLWLAFFRDPPEPEVKAAATPAATTMAALVPPVSNAATVAPVYANAQDYAAHHQPRIAEAPWSMPALDGRGVVAEPELYCMSSGRGRGGTCTCLTEQGTRYLLPRPRCEYVARWGGSYNPYRAPRHAEAMQPLQTGQGGPSDDASSISHNVYYVRTASAGASAQTIAYDSPAKATRWPQ